jgi:uncharacterized membrane protein
VTTTPVGGPGKSTTGLDPNMAGALAYVGGALTGIALLVVEKDSRYVRFHAMQSTITFLGVLVLHLALTALGVIGWMLYPFFIAAVLVLWVVLIVKALNGQQFKLPYVGEMAEKRL